MIKGEWNHDPITDFGALASSRRIRFKDKRHHPGAVRYWPEALKVDRLSRDDLVALQQQRLQELVEHAVLHVPFYRDWAGETGFSPGDPVDINTLPMVSKADFTQDIERFQSDAFDPSELVAGKTSGSSGVPFRFRKHPDASDYTYCCLWRALHRYGLRPGDRRVYLWGRSYSFKNNAFNNFKHRQKLRLRDWLNNTLAIGAYDLTYDNVRHNIERIEQFSPVYMHGYVSAQYIIARTLLEDGRTLRAPRLKAIVTESEKVYDFQRETMEKAFGCPVLEHYGSVEFGNIAQPDPDGNMRINEDIFVVERAENGEAVITGLFSHAFPFIRYRLGDLIEFDEEIRPGLPYRSLKEIVGRTVDMVPVPAGGFVHGVALAHLIDPHLDYVLKYQIHQTQLDHFIVRLVTKSPLPEASKATIRNDLSGLVGQSARIDIEEVDHIEPAASGKFRWVMSDLNMNQHQPTAE